MSKIEVIYYDVNKIYRFIKENLYSCRTSFTKVDNARFHHNIDYRHVPSVMKHGILSYRHQKKIIDKRVLTKEEEMHYGDDFHVNGTDCISLSTFDIDMSRVSDDEWLYDYRMCNDADILISSDVKAFRNTTNYANEFLVDHIIQPKYFKAIDLRLLSRDNTSDDSKVRKLINNYNYLRSIAISLYNKGLNIPLRERGMEDFNLDVNKVRMLPKLRVK